MQASRPRAGGKAASRSSGAKARSSREHGRGPGPVAGARDSHGPRRPRDGRVVAIHETRSEGQRIAVEDDARVRWMVDCLGEPVREGTRVRFEPLAHADPERRGVLVRVLDEERESWVCTLRRRGGALVLVPFGGAELPTLSLAAKDARGARDGDRVIVARAVEARPRRSKRERGAPVRRRERAIAVRVIEILGRAGEPDADHRALAWKYRLPAAFSRRARLESEQLADALPRAELGSRLDLRHLPFITIDPASARDHDDALYAEPRREPALELVGARAGESSTARSGREPERPGRRAREGWAERLWVAIADVSHFVSAGGFVDAEARRRGNSFYFPDRAIPMLPERLSSDLCSLRPDADRLVLVAELRLSDEGEMLDALFHEAVIRSHAKLSYEEAADWLASAPAGLPSREPEAGDDRDSPASPVAATASTPTWLASLLRLARLAERLAERRRRGGAIELELPEMEIEVDDEGRPVDARLRQRNPAHALVEEAMLAANQAVARALERARRDTLHRVHPAPDPRRLEELGLFLERLGLADAGDLEEPGTIARMLRAVRGWPSEERIHLATLRAMSQARYEVRSRGHFALQFSHYLHFTSPIRRYADLSVHRRLKQWLRGHPPADRESANDARELERLAIWLSGRERVAAEAEREAAAFACCALLAGREGESFDAAVTGVGEHGLFVRLERPAASGLVPLQGIDPHWRLDADAERLEEGHGGRTIELGSRLRVRLTAVDGDRGRLAFALVGPIRDAAASSPGEFASKPRTKGRTRGRSPAQSSARASDRDSHSR